MGFLLTYATMRNLEKADSVNTLANKERLPIKVLQLDVTDDNSVNDAIQTIISEAGRIDVCSMKPLAISIWTHKGNSGGPSNNGKPTVRHHCKSKLWRWNF